MPPAERATKIRQADSSAAPAATPRRGMSKRITIPVMAMLLHHKWDTWSPTSLMPSQPKPKSTILLNPVPHTRPDSTDIASMIDSLLDVLERHDAGPNEGVVALLTSFVQSASRILDLSAHEEAEQNRESLLAMLEHARRAIDTWSLGVPVSGHIH
jgi:hypothetical protein